jgi:hypothetical protein
LALVLVFRLVGSIHFNYSGINFSGEKGRAPG